MQQLIKIFAVSLLCGILSLGCKKPILEENDEEIITTLQLTFSPVGGGSDLVYEFNDIDGSGGNAPIVDSIKLTPSKTYNVKIKVLNKSGSPEIDITPEIIEEADAHRFYFEPSATSNITITNFDTDDNGVPLGLSSTWTTGAAANGAIVISLRHYGGTPPGKEVNDTPNNTKSEADIEVSFNTILQ